jgi:hypothetical protein
MSDYDGEEIFLPEVVERWPRREALAWHRGYWADGEGDRLGAINHDFITYATRLVNVRR